MYTRTHTHTQARTHTTKFSGHVVRFFFFSLFSFLLFAIRVSTRRKLFGAPILYSTGGTQKQAQSSHTIVTSQHRCTHIRSASPSRDKHSPSPAESRYIHYGATPLFFFTWSQGVWSWWGVVSHLRRLGPRNSATCVLLYHTSVSALYILLKECTTARTTSKHARTVNENNDGDGILHRDRMDNAYANAALEGTTLLDSSVFPPLTYNTRTWRQNVCT